MKWVRRVRWLSLFLLAFWFQFGAVEWWTGFIIDDLVCSMPLFREDPPSDGRFSADRYEGRTVCVVGYDDDYVYLYQPGFRQTSFGRIRTPRPDGILPYLWGAKFHIAGWDGTLNALGYMDENGNTVDFSHNEESDFVYDGPVGRFTGFASLISMMPGIWFFLCDKDAFTLV